MSNGSPSIDTTENVIEWFAQFLNDIISIGQTIFQADLTFTIVIAFITAFAGAFAGAYGAQRVIERGKVREEITKEIRNNNSAISMAHGIFNFFFALKKQHVAELKNDFEKHRTAILGVLDKAQQDRSSKTVIHFQAKLMTLQPSVLPIEQLQTAVYDKLSVTERPLSLTMALAGVASSLNQSIVERNEWIQDFRSRPELSDYDQANLYFGFPNKEGHTDSNYPMYIDAIFRQTNDCIFFSKLLIEDLAEHGANLTRAYTKQFRGKAPRVTKIDLSSLKDDPLMPSPDEYVDWIEKFKKKN